MKIKNEKKLSKLIHLYNGLNFKTKFNLNDDEYNYLRKKYKVHKLSPRNERLCWKCDVNHPSDTIKSTNMCTSCYYSSAFRYKLIYKIDDKSDSLINKICLKFKGLNYENQ